MAYFSPQYLSQQTAPRTLKDGKPTDDELKGLAKKIVKWKTLGRCLGVFEPNLEEIDQAYDQVSEKGYHMLKYWKQRKGSSATYKALCDALKHEFVQRKDLAERFCYIDENTRDKVKEMSAPVKIKPIMRVKDGTPTDDELERLAYEIVEWRMLGHHLGVSRPKLDEMDRAHVKLSEKGYHMLMHWKQQKGSSATYKALCDVLKHKFIQREDLAERFCYINVKDGKPTDDELKGLADEIVEWKALGRCLGVGDLKLEKIDQAHDQLCEKGYHMLKYWKRRKGSSATYKALCDALKHRFVQRADLAEQFCYINGKTRNYLQQMKSETRNMSDKLDTLMAQRETEDEDKTRDDSKEMERKMRTISEKLKSHMTSGEKGNVQETRNKKDIAKESPFHHAASTSRKVLEEEKQSLSSDKTLRFTLLSSEWKSSKGGLSTINRELAIQLAKHPNVEAYVYLPKCSEEEKKVAGSHCVKLIEAEELPGFEPINWLASLPKDHLPHCVMGHGLPLGRQIPLIKRHHDCQWIQVVHTAPEELGMYKSYEEAIFKGEQKHQAEVKLCELADQVVAVGPKLADAYSRYLRFSKKGQDVLNLTPSIFTEFLGVQQATEERRKFFVLVFGRGDREDFKLKGYDIAVQAVAELKDSSYQLMFVGAPAGKEDEVAEKLLQHGIPPSQLTVRRFTENREQLANLFCEVDLAIMPSRTEGFGLTALEALSAGLPVLVSGNSGLGDALKKVSSGVSHVVDSEDPKEWAKAIKIVRGKSREVRLEDANLLREQYKVKYSWKEQCDYLEEEMRHLCFGSIQDKLERVQNQVENVSEKMYNLGKPKNTSRETESIRDKLEQMKSEMENNIRGEMKEMKERLNTLTASLEENKDEENFKDKFEQMRGEMVDLGERLENSLENLRIERGESEEKERYRDDLNKMRSEIENVSGKLDALTVSRQETKEEDKTTSDLEQMEREIQATSEKLKSQMTLGEEVDERVIRNAAIKFEAEHEECVRVLPYLQNGDVEIHLYVYSDRSGIPTELKNAAQAFFGQKGWKLIWADLYNDVFNLLKITPIEYLSGSPKRLEASQVDKIDEIINKHLHVFSKHRNVTAVQPSFKVTNSVQTEEACIVVYVLGKGQIPMGESAIPCTIGSYPVDIVNGFYVRTKDPYQTKNAHEQEEFLRLGTSIGVNGKQLSGTLGAIVEDINSGTLYALSCDHVMNDAVESEIIHPGLDVYLNYLHYNLNEYKGYIGRISRDPVELRPIPNAILAEPAELQKMFSELKTTKEKYSASEGCSRGTLQNIKIYEEKLEKAFGKPPRVIAKYIAGVRCNVGSERNNGREHFIDAAISELNEDEVKKLKANKDVEIIDTTQYPSGECISATNDVNVLFKSGSATGFTQSSLLLGEAREPPVYILGFRPNGNSAWTDVKCINCNKRGTAQSEVPKLLCPRKQCKPDGWLKRCLCIQRQRPYDYPFSGDGDSGAVVFEKRGNQTASPGFGIIFGALPSQYHKLTLASPLDIALEVLSQKVSESRPDSKPCQLRLSSRFV